MKQEFFDKEWSKITSAANLKPKTKASYRRPEGLLHPLELESNVRGGRPIPHSIHFFPHQKQGIKPYVPGWPVCICLFERSASWAPLTTSWMGAESKNPGTVISSMLHQGVLPMLSCANTLMRPFTRHTFSGCFRLRAKNSRWQKHLSRAPLNMTALIYIFGQRHNR